MWQLTGTVGLKMRAIKRKNLYPLANTTDKAEKETWNWKEKKKDKQLARMILQETNHLRWALKS